MQKEISILEEQLQKKDPNTLTKIQVLFFIKGCKITVEGYTNIKRLK